jgi:hypothetical protein
MAVYWGFQQPSLKQGAAGTVHFEPGGVAFWDNQRPRVATEARQEDMRRFLVPELTRSIDIMDNK